MKKYLPFILILILVILILGSSFFNSSSSNVPSIKLASIITKVLHRLGEDGNSVSTINLILRKLAHFMEYLVLTILLSIGFLSTVKKQGWAFLTSAITAGFVSLIDEAFIQSVSGRNSSFFDIFVDFLGIGAGLLVYALMSWLNVKSRR
ncbi:MAG: VanZ family protein [Thermoclostridium sp.]|nr:VanZ family protein [Thermoclostridium sp.]